MLFLYKYVHKTPLHMELFSFKNVEIIYFENSQLHPLQSSTCPQETSNQQQP